MKNLEYHTPNYSWGYSITPEYQELAKDDFAPLFEQIKELLRIEMGGLEDGFVV